MSKTTKAEFLAAWKKVEKAIEAAGFPVAAGCHTSILDEIRKTRCDFHAMAERYAAALAEEGEKLNQSKGPTL